MAGTAVAGPADAPAAEPPVIVETAPSAYDWTGFYVGGSIASGRGDMDFDVTTGGDERRERSAFGGEAEGTFGSVRFGYDRMTASGWVFGGFLDLGFGELTGSASNDGEGHGGIEVRTQDGGPPASVDFAYSHISMIALRAGPTFGPAGRGLFYALAGVGMAEVDITGTGDEGPFRNASASDDVTGAVFGVGAEYAVRDNFSVFAEYNYFDFSGSVEVPCGGDLCEGNPVLTARTHEVQVVRLGVNFRF
ncbi:outer membrane beta-barrel protein [Rhodobacterales bacterium HKCCSP123]|nr:outer membrane beta-barrel protein [Rhodobacterales bacterium HKCCSP123]